MSAFSLGLGLGACVAVAADDIAVVPATPVPPPPPPPPPPPELLLPGDGTVEIAVAGAIATVTVADTGLYDGTYAVATAEFATGPVYLVAPALMGGTELGSVLTFRPGLVIRPSDKPLTAPETLEIRRDGAAIPGATGLSHTITADDQGKTLTLAGIVANADGTRVAVSAPLAIPVPVIPAPENTAAPAVTGTEQVGRRLAASGDAWSNAPTSHAYRWKRGSTLIDGATSATYVPVAADAGQTLTGEVQATNAGGSSAWVASAPTRPILKASLIDMADTTAPGYGNGGGAFVASEGIITHTRPASGGQYGGRQIAGTLAAGTRYRVTYNVECAAATKTNLIIEGGGATYSSVAFDSPGSGRRTVTGFITTPANLARTSLLTIYQHQPSTTGAVTKFYPIIIEAAP